jgi:hypothetical protein
MGTWSVLVPVLAFLRSGKKTPGILLANELIARVTAR